MNPSPTTPAQALAEIEAMEVSAKSVWTGPPGDILRALTLAREGWTEVERCQAGWAEAFHIAIQKQDALKTAEAKATTLADEVQRLRDGLIEMVKLPLPYGARRMAQKLLASYRGPQGEGT